MSEPFKHSESDTRRRSLAFVTNWLGTLVPVVSHDTRTYFAGENTHGDTRESQREYANLNRAMHGTHDALVRTARVVCLHAYVEHTTLEEVKSASRLFHPLGSAELIRQGIRKLFRVMSPQAVFELMGESRFAVSAPVFFRIYP